jgi:hypothetical protein
MICSLRQKEKANLTGDGMDEEAWQRVFYGGGSEPEPEPECQSGGVQVVQICY